MDTGKIYASVSLADNSTTVYSGPVFLHGVIVTTAISAHVCPVQDNATPVATLPASAAAGTYIDCFGLRCETSLVVDPDDSATGTITVIYSPNHEGEVGSGAGLP